MHASGALAPQDPYRPLPTIPVFHDRLFAQSGIWAAELITFASLTSEYDHLLWACLALFTAPLALGKMIYLRSSERFRRLNTFHSTALHHTFPYYLTDTDITT